MQGVAGERHHFDTRPRLMAGRGPAPDPQRLRRGAPARGDWSPSADGGWQGELPEPPPGLLPGSVAVWGDWFRAWWASNWTTDDLPTLRLTIRLWDRVHRGDVKRLPELRQWLDSAGITPKGRQDRRWVQPPKPRTTSTSGRSGRFDHLRHPDDPQYQSRSAVDRFLDAEEAARQASVKERFGGRPTAKERLRRIIDEDSPSARFERIQAEKDAGRS